MTKIKRIRCLALAGVMATAAPATAFAASETLLLEAAKFNDCVKIIDTMVSELNANPIQIETVAHSSALYKVKFKSVEANLEFHCNSVNQTMEVRRVTPGEWSVAEQ